MKIGYDLDGVLANFTDRYADYLTKRTGVVFPLASRAWPTAWHWDRVALREAGLSDEASTEAIHWTWEAIKGSSSFWEGLTPLPDAFETLNKLATLRVAGHDVYFITSRVGTYAKKQSENWLRWHGYEGVPTVLLSEDKGSLAAGLTLDAFVDDRVENIVDVYKARRGRCQCFLMDAAYNSPGVVGGALDGLPVRRVTSPLEPIEWVHGALLKEWAA